MAHGLTHAYDHGRARIEGGCCAHELDTIWSRRIGTRPASPPPAPPTRSVHSADRARRLSFERLAVRRRKRGVSPVRVAIGSDHAGYRLKAHFLAILTHLGHAAADL